MNIFTGWNGRAVELRDCPFCGSIPELIHIGNEFTRSRKLKIKCKVCRIERTDAARIFDFNWLEDVAVKAWNSRVDSRQ